MKINLKAKRREETRLTNTRFKIARVLRQETKNRLTEEEVLQNLNSYKGIHEKTETHNRTTEKDKTLKYEKIATDAAIV